MEDLLNEDYFFLMTDRFQSNPNRKTLLKISTDEGRGGGGGDFERRVQSSEKILQMKSLATRLGSSFGKWISNLMIRMLIYKVF